MWVTNHTELLKRGPGNKEPLGEKKMQVSFNAPFTTGPSTGKSWNVSSSSSPVIIKSPASVKTCSAYPSHNRDSNRDSSLIQGGWSWEKGCKHPAVCLPPETSKISFSRGTSCCLKRLVYWTEESISRPHTLSKPGRGKQRRGACWYSLFYLLQSPKVQKGPSAPSKEANWKRAWNLVRRSLLEKRQTLQVPRCGGLGKSGG